MIYIRLHHLLAFFLSKEVLLLWIYGSRPVDVLKVPGSTRNDIRVSEGRRIRTGRVNSHTGWGHGALLQRTRKQESLQALLQRMQQI